jgi:hypothetical protein
MKLHILYADDHIVIATPHEGSVHYAKNALDLEARHKTRVESVGWENSFPVIQYMIPEPFDPAVFDPHSKAMPVYESPTLYATEVTHNLTDSVNRMREIIHARILYPFETTDG